MLATRSNHPLALIRSPYDMVHMNVDFAFTVRDGRQSIPVIANFDKVIELTTGDFLLSGSAIDEYGWWHRTITVRLNDVNDIARATDRPTPPEPAPFRVGVTFEWRRGLVRLTVPDDVARRLAAWSREHWHEFAGMGAGYSDNARRGTWEHRALAYLHSVQSHLHDDMPFIEGETFSSLKDKWGNARSGAYELFVSTSGIRCDGRTPTRGFHFSG